MPQWNAAILFPLMVVLSLITIMASLGVTNYLNSVFDLRIVGLVIYASLIFINYILFIRNKKYKGFEEAFDQLDKARQKSKYITGILITVLGYALPIVLIILMVALS
jgi:hypothetical protein